MRFERAYSPLRAIDGAWRALQVCPAPLIIGGLLLAILTGEGWVDLGGEPKVARVGASSRGAFYGWSFRSYLLAGGLAGFVLSTAAWLFACLVRIGLAEVTEGALSRGYATVGQVFEARGRYVGMLLATLLHGLIGLLLLVPLMLAGFVGVGAPEIDLTGESFGLPQGAGQMIVFLATLLGLLVASYILLGISLMVPAVAVEGLGPKAALIRSWSLARGHRLRLLWYHFVLVVFTLAGLLVCCVGVVATLTIVEVAYFESYLRLVRPPAEQVHWEQDA